MRLNDYQTAAARTGNLPTMTPEVAAGSLLLAETLKREGLVHATLGLCGEAGEYYLTPTDDEAGDVLWYCAEITRFCGVRLGDVPSAVIRAGASDSVIVNAASVAETVKKAVYHGKPLDVTHIAACVGVVVDALSTRHNLGAVAEQNIAKLRERYPDGFVEGGGNRRATTTEGPK